MDRKLSKNLRGFRSEKKLSLEQLSVLTGISVKRLMALELGEKPKCSELVKIGSVYGLTADDCYHNFKYTQEELEFANNDYYLPEEVEGFDSLSNRFNFHRRIGYRTNSINLCFISFVFVLILSVLFFIAPVLVHEIDYIPYNGVYGSLQTTKSLSLFGYKSGETLFNTLIFYLLAASLIVCLISCFIMLFWGRIVPVTTNTSTIRLLNFISSFISCLLFVLFPIRMFIEYNAEITDPSNSTTKFIIKSSFTHWSYIISAISIMFVAVTMIKFVKSAKRNI